MTITAWFLITTYGYVVPNYSPPFTTEAECLKVKSYLVTERKLDSDYSKCMQLSVFVSR